MRPLDGIKVLDFTHGVAGPYRHHAARRPRRRRDQGREARPRRRQPLHERQRPRSGPTSRASAATTSWRSTATSARSTLDLEQDRRAASSRVELARLGRHAWCRTSGPGVMGRLGLDYAALRARNPGVIYASLTAYGASGAARPPARHGRRRAGPFGRHVDHRRRAASGPVRPGASLADFSGGVHLVVAVLAALLHRERTGEGQELGVSLLDATMIMLTNYSVAVLDGDADIRPMGSGHPQLVPFQAFPTADGHIVIATGHQQAVPAPVPGARPPRPRRRPAVRHQPGARQQPRRARRDPLGPARARDDRGVDRPLRGGGDPVRARPHPARGVRGRAARRQRHGAHRAASRARAHCTSSGSRTSSRRAPARSTARRRGSASTPTRCSSETLGIEAAELDTLRRDGVI